LNNFAEPVVSLVTGHVNDAADHGPTKLVFFGPRFLGVARDDTDWMEGGGNISTNEETYINVWSIWNPISYGCEMFPLLGQTQESARQDIASSFTKPDSCNHKETSTLLSPADSSQNDFTMNTNSNLDEQQKPKQEENDVMTDEYNMSNKRKLHFVYPGEYSEPSSAKLSCDSMNQGNRAQSWTSYPGISKPALIENSFNSTYNTGAFPSKDTYHSTMQQPANRSSRNDNDIHGPKPSTFVTAKQQYIIDCKTKNQRGDGNQSNSGGSSSYGSNARRTLGTRICQTQGAAYLRVRLICECGLSVSAAYLRGPSSKFVPPLPRNSSDEDTMPSGECMRRKTGDKDTGELDSGLGMDECLKNIEPKMVELIMNEIMDHGPPVTWDDIAGLEFAKNVIKEIVVWPMLRPMEQQQMLMKGYLLSVPPI
ncbi:hypothetical protein QZH41_018158, partial [Actinostola sp. cb2023]